MMKDISHLPPDEKKHFHFCEYCERYFDRRNLAQVFLHAEGDCVAGEHRPKNDFAGSTRVSVPEHFFNGDDRMRINPN